MLASAKSVKPTFYNNYIPKNITKSLQNLKKYYKNITFMTHWRIRRVNSPTEPCGKTPQ
jgi:hypothetical protein